MASRRGRSWRRCRGRRTRRWPGWTRGRSPAFVMELLPGPQYLVGEGDGDRAAGVAAVPARDRADGRPLAGAVPAVAGWRLAALPRGPAAAAGRGAAGRLRPRRPRSGLRDHAVLVVLARLGLRGAEVAALQLADIDWRAGEIAVRGKGSRVERLPLPAAAGQALADWLTDGRPRCESRAVFVTVRGGRYRPLTPGRSGRSWAGPASGPGCPGWARTGCATRWRPRCCAPARRCPRSGRCCGTAASCPPRSMPRSTSNALRPAGAAVAAEPMRE